MIAPMFGTGTIHTSDFSVSGLLVSFVGAVVLLARHGRVALFESLGQRDPAVGAPMQRDAVFRGVAGLRCQPSLAKASTTSGGA